MQFKKKHTRRGTHKSINSERIKSEVHVMCKCNPCSLFIPYHPVCKCAYILPYMCQYFATSLFLLTVIRSILVIKPSNHVNNISVSELPAIADQSTSLFLHIYSLAHPSHNGFERFEWMWMDWSELVLLTKKTLPRWIHSTNIF